MHTDENKDKCSTARQDKIEKWDNIGIDEKIKRLHATILELRHNLSFSHQEKYTIDKRLHALENHQHAQDGKVLVEIAYVQRGNSVINVNSSSIDILA